LAAGSCVEVEQGEVEFLSIEGFRICEPTAEDFRERIDWIFPPVFGCARFATIHDTAEAAYSAYLLGNDRRSPRRHWRQAVEVTVAFDGLELSDEIEAARADQILQSLEDQEASLRAKLRRVERKGGQGVVLQASCGGTAVVLLDDHFWECVEFGDVVEFDPDSLVP
jgi:hypothetical protein